MFDFSLPDNWKKSKIREISKILSGATPVRSNHDKYFAHGNIPWVKTKDLTNGRVSMTDEKITELAIKESSCPLLNPGTVLVAMYGGFKQIGRTGIMTFRGSINQAISAIIPDEKEAIPEYILYWLNGNIDLWRRYAASSRKDPNITQKDVGDFPILLPPIPEQRKIAEILTSWDRTIELVGHKIESKRRLKKGLMQQLLTGKLRFPGFEDEREEMQLSQFLRLRLRKVDKPKEAYLRLGVRSHGRGTFTTIVEDPKTVGMTHLYQAREGDLIVSITFAWEGAIAMVESDGDCAYVSHRFPTFLLNTKKIVPEFFRYLMHTPRFFYDLGVVSPGGAGRNRVMSKRNFLKIKVRVPSIGEQRKIGGLLTALDKDINRLAELLVQLKKQKKGLMQKLLTGEVRVNV